MAINIRVEDGLSMTIQQTRSILQTETAKFGVFIDLDRAIEYQLHFRMLASKYVKELYEFLGPNLAPTQNIKVREWFMGTFNIPERLMKTKANKTAFDSAVRSNLLEANIDADAKKFIESYNSWSFNNYRDRYLKQYLSRPISYGVSDIGHRMVIARPHWNILSTSRLSADDPSIQNLARDMKDLICTPQGWILVRADSSQIEPRITYSRYIDDELIREFIVGYDDAYYGLYSYCNLPESVYANRELYCVAGSERAKTADPKYIIDVKEITPEMASGRAALKRLALAATYGSGLKDVDPLLAARYHERIVAHPSYVEWEARVTAEVKRGVDTFYGTFGSPIVPEETTTYKPGTAAWGPHLIRCGINNPIQTTASELMTESVYEAQKILSHTEKTHIAYYKHDEGAFYVHESEKSIIPELEEITAYNVTENGKPWIPIGSDLEMGQAKPNEAVPSVLNWS